jgi:hypothetical protein
VSLFNFVEWSYLPVPLPTILITVERKSSAAAASWKKAGDISSGPFFLCSSSTGAAQCSFTAAHTRRFSEGCREYPSITSLGLWTAHVDGIAVESLAASTSNPACSSTFLRTSARAGSRDTTRIFSLSAITSCDAAHQSVCSVLGNKSRGESPVLAPRM